MCSPGRLRTSDSESHPLPLFGSDRFLSRGGDFAALRGGASLGGDLVAALEGFESLGDLVGMLAGRLNLVAERLPVLPNNHPKIALVIFACMLHTALAG